jgi:hypothetical protein
MQSSIYADLWQYTFNASYTPKEAYDFLVSVRPEIAIYDEMPRDFNSMLMLELEWYQ